MKRFVSARPFFPLLISWKLIPFAPPSAKIPGAPSSTFDNDSVGGFLLRMNCDADGIVSETFAVAKVLAEFFPFSNASMVSLRSSCSKRSSSSLLCSAASSSAPSSSSDSSSDPSSSDPSDSSESSSSTLISSSDIPCSEFSTECSSSILFIERSSSLVPSIKSWLSLVSMRIPAWAKRRVLAFSWLVASYSSDSTTALCTSSQHL
mmetsp:Transcript_15413/g.23043  ORF Transcript_15413/g.23043 Transcript_15413/m.23043 type:complete len:206 (-) Transcript_15413:672-1289(-)